MKAKLILINFCASWIGLAVDTELTPLWICLLAVAWFLISCMLFLRATRRGYYKEIEKQYKINEL